MKKAGVFLVIQGLTEISMRDRRIDKSAVVERVAECIDSDIRDFQDENGQWVQNLNELDPEITRTIKDVKIKKNYDPAGNYLSSEIVDITLYDKLKAAELLGREVELFKQRSVQEVKGKVSLEVGLREAEERYKERIGQMKDVTPKSLGPPGFEEED